VLVNKSNKHSILSSRDGNMVEAKTRRPLISYLSSFAIVLVDMSLMDFAGAIFPIFEAARPHLDRARR